MKNTVVLQSNALPFHAKKLTVGSVDGLQLVIDQSTV